MSEQKTSLGRWSSAKVEVVRKLRFWFNAPEYRYSVGDQVRVAPWSSDHKGRVGLVRRAKRFGKWYDVCFYGGGAVHRLHFAYLVPDESTPPVSFWDIVKWSGNPSAIEEVQVYGNAQEWGGVTPLNETERYNEMLKRLHAQWDSEVLGG